MRLDVIEKIINIPISIGLEEFIIHFYGWALQIRSFFRILFLWIFSYYLMMIFDTPNLDWLPFKKKTRSNTSLNGKNQTSSQQKKSCHRVRCLQSNKQSSDQTGNNFFADFD